MTESYEEFLARKQNAAPAIGFDPGDIVFSPFAGIGSELYCAIEMGRKAIGAELKESYFRQAITNLKSIKKAQSSLFDAAQ
jgi:DNA modification methylase